MSFIPPGAGNPIAGMNGSAIFSLGGITFDAALFEVPQDLEATFETWGSVHKIPTSGTSAPKKIAQTFGVFPKAITWEGHFLARVAETKLRALLGLQQAQQVVTFTMGSQAWDCVIWEVKETYRSHSEIGFTITVEPLAYRSGTTPASTAPIDASTNLQSQFVSLQNLQSAAPSSDPLAPSVVSTIASVLAGIQAVQPESLAGTSALLNLGSAIITPALASLNVLVAQLAASGADNALYLYLGSVIACISSYDSTLQGFTGADNFTQVQVRQGDNLFATAAVQFGDWTRAFDIAQLNGIDVFIPSAQMVSIPRQ